MAEYHQIGKYVLLKELPETPLGRNFRAAELGPTGLNRIVHLTRLVDEVTPEVQFQQTLQAKFDGIKNLLHEGIIKPLEVKNLNGVFVSQEFVEGFSIKQVLNRCVKNSLPFSVDYAIYTVARLCNTLEYSHSQSVLNAPVLHGGLTPYNIYYTFDGEVKVMDWNIVASSETMATARNIFLQRYQLYLSPGQTEGRPTVQTSDVFQMGLLFYEMVTGAPLYTINRQENIEQMVEKLYTEQKTIDGKPIPDEIIRIISKALAVNPNLRYPSIKAMREDIDTLLYSGTYLATATKTSFFLNSVYKEEIKAIRGNVERELALNYAPYIAKLAEKAAATPGAEEVTAEEITSQILPASEELIVEPEGIEIEADDDFRTYTRKKQVPYPLIAGVSVVTAIVVAIILLIVGGTKEQDIKPVVDTDAMIKQEEEKAALEQRTRELEARLNNAEQEKEQTAARLQELQRLREERRQLEEQQAEEERKLQEAQAAQAQKDAAEQQRQREAERRRREQQKLIEQARAREGGGASGTPARTEPAPTRTGNETGTQSGGNTGANTGSNTGNTSKPATQPTTTPTTTQPAQPQVVNGGDPGLVMSPISRIAPKYPRSLSRAGIRRSGSVQILVMINSNGTVQSARPLGGDPVFHTEAVKAVEKWRWTAPTKNGKPVLVSMVVQVNFNP